MYRRRQDSSGFAQSFTLDVDGYAVVELSADDVLNPGVGGGVAVESKGFSITSGEVLKAYVLNRGGVGADMASLIDADKLGADYVVAAYHNTRFDLYQTYDDQLSIQATQDDTTVTVSPKGSPPFTVKLDAGQTYISSGDDITGLFVSADKPIDTERGPSQYRRPAQQGRHLLRYPESPSLFSYALTELRKRHISCPVGGHEM